MSTNEHSTANTGVPSEPAPSSRSSHIEDLRMMLENHLALSEPKDRVPSEQLILGLVGSLIDNVPDDELSKELEKDAKETFRQFLRKRNRSLATKSLERIEEGKFNAVLTSFSRVGSDHMTRMKVTILDSEPIESVIEKKDELEAFAHHREQYKTLEPSNGNLDMFIRLEYPEHPDNIISMSEVVANHKVLQFFRLADLGQQDNTSRILCWVLLPELVLFKLTAKSLPSEIITALEAPQAYSSTFLTGSTDMMWMSLVKNISTIDTSATTRLGIAEELLDTYNEKHIAVTYQYVHDMAQRHLRDLSESRGTQTKLGWEFLMIEVKRAWDPRSKDPRVDHNDFGPDTAEKFTSQDVEDLRNERDSSESNNANVVEHEDRESSGLANDDVNDQVLRPEDIKVEGVQTDLQSWLGLKDYLPQVISQCLAVQKGSPALGPKIIKFVLTDGENWIFGLVNCSGGRNGRKCYTTNISITPRDQSVLRGQVKQVLELLVLWALSPGQLLQKLFTKSKSGPVTK